MTRIRRVMPDLVHDDLDAARRFYCDLVGFDVGMDLGWIVTFVAPDEPRAQVSVLRADASAAVPPDVSIEVDDVDGVHARARAQGREIVHPVTDERWGVRRFFVRDPGGAVVNVLAHHPRRASGPQ